jgi:hypothetical protein
VSTHYNEAQFLLAMARAAYWTAIVQSGAYRLRQTQVGCGRNEDGSIKFRPKTDDEKLASAVATVERHLAIAAEFAEHLPVQGMARRADDLSEEDRG